MSFRYSVSLGAKFKYQRDLGNKQIRPSKWYAVTDF